MTSLLFLGGGAFVVAFAVGLAIASTRRRYCVLVLLGVVLVVAWFGLALLTANTDPNHRNCSDCEYIWGRWWWPPLFVTVLGLNLVGWLAGATAGWLARRVRRPT
ncbi:MAG: hypothetical protein ACJ738_04305 [Gaiellales bacterium]|jgi:hypothetical protein